MVISNMFQGQKAAAKHITKMDVNRLAIDSVLRNAEVPKQEAPRDVWGDEQVEADRPKLGHEITFMEEKIRSLEDEDDSENDAKTMYRFNLVMGSVVILNVFAIALEIDWGPSGDDVTAKDRIGWIIIESVFVVIFIGEICVRLYVEGRRWSKSAWNWFDGLVVTCAVLDVWVLSFLDDVAGGLHSVTILRFSRLVRLVRMVKLVRMLGGLYIMVLAFWHALQSMFFLGLMMTFGILIYAIFAVTLIGRNTSFDDIRIGHNNDTVYSRFGTVYSAMYTLFEIMTLEGWEEVARPLVMKQPLTFVFIGSFILIFTFGLLNMIVALVVQKTLEQTRAVDDLSQREHRRQIEKELFMMRTVFTRDSENSGDPAGEVAITITYEQFEQALLTNEVLRAHVLSSGIHLTEAHELFTVLDWDDSGEVSMRELMDGLSKLQAGAPSPWDALATHAGVRKLLKHADGLQASLNSLGTEQADHQAKLEARLEDQSRSIQEMLTSLHALRSHGGLFDAPRCRSCQSSPTVD